MFYLSTDIVAYLGPVRTPDNPSRKPLTASAQAPRLLRTDKYRILMVTPDSRAKINL